MPDVCPACGEKVFKDEDGPFVRCINGSCPAQTVRNIIHFVSKSAMDIDGLGEMQIARLAELGIITDASDLYFLTAEKLSNLDRYGEKSISNLLEAIERSKNNNLDRLINALGIREVGEKAAKILAARFGNIERLANATAEELVGAEDIGPVTAEYITEYFSEKKNTELIEKLKKAGVNTVYREETVDSEFEGLTFVLTGTLEKYSRDEASALIEAKKGKVSGSVSKKTSYVVAGEKSGSKEEKARQLGIPVISEADFEKMLGNS